VPRPMPPHTLSGKLTTSSSAITFMARPMPASRLPEPASHIRRNSTHTARSRPPKQCCAARCCLCHVVPSLCCARVVPASLAHSPCLLSLFIASMETNSRWRPKLNATQLKNYNMIIENFTWFKVKLLTAATMASRWPQIF
jgi:hypothetical protein